MADWHPAAEEYCETVFELTEDDITVRRARIAERLGVSRPAVSEMVSRLEHDGLVESDGGVITLTTTGHDLASQVVRRHRLAERFLTDVLGMSWAQAHHEAGKWEHIISDDVDAALARILGDPTTCPHGNPIPGTPYRMPADAVRLVDVAVGTEFLVERIPEELEFADGVLDYLEACGVVPGRTGRVSAASPDGTVTVEIDGRVTGLGQFSSRRILVSVPTSN